MTPDELRDRYDEQLRAEAEVADADEITRIGPLFAATFPRRHRGFLTHRPLPEGTDLDDLIARAVEHYSRDERVSHFEWKTRGHDAAPELEDALRRHGFEFEERETVMIGEVDGVIAAAEPIPEGYTVERASDEATIRAAEELAGRVFGDSPDRSTAQADELVRRFRHAPEEFEMWLVRSAEAEVVCSGRVDFVDGTDFAGLWGGACDEEHRGKGLYRAITAERAKSAKARGKKYLQSDCTEYSRPILQRAGLVPVTTTTPAIWRRASSTAL